MGADCAVFEGDDVAVFETLKLEMLLKDASVLMLVFELGTGMVIAITVVTVALEKAKAGPSTAVGVAATSEETVRAVP